MKGWTYPYLDLVSLPSVGNALLDPRPAFVFGADGARLLWANAAGAAFFGEHRMGELLRRTFSDLNPIKAQAARLSRLLPSEAARMEVLRIGQGVGLATLPAACRRLNLAGDVRAVLAVAASSAVAASLAARAERLVEMVGGGDRLAAVVTSDGKVIAASAGFDQAMPAGPVDRMIAAARASPDRIVKAPVDKPARPAGVARFNSDGRDCFLIIVGPADEAEAEVPAPATTDNEVDALIEMPVEAMLPDLGDVDQESDAEAPAPAGSPRPDERTEHAALDIGVPAGQSPAHEAQPMPETGPAATEHGVQEDLDDAARKSVEEGLRHRQPAALGHEVRQSSGAPFQPSNIVRLPGAPPVRIPPEKLTGTERDAFRRIAEALGKNRTAGERDTPLAEAPADRAEPGEAASVQTTAIDTRLLDRLPIGIAIFRDRKTLFGNRALLDLLAYDSFEAFVAAGGAEAIFPSNGGLAGNIAAAGGTLAARRSDGGTVPVKAWLHAVTFSGTTSLMLSISADQARADEGRDDAAAELAGSEARAEELEAILDTATDGVIVIDGRGKIGSMNRAAEALFGVNAGDYLGRYFTDLLADESQKPALDYLDGLRSNGVASVLNDGREVIGRVPQGGLIPLFMTMGRVADKTGGVDKFCAVLRDITHWKNVEGELVAARRAAEAANQQKSDFLAKISHEIRTPLNAIIGFSEVMMEQRFGPIGNERYRDYLHDIHVSGAHLMSLINDLLDLSKIEAGKLELSFEAVPANTVIQECVALMQPQANRERIIIRTSLAADVPRIVADPRSFRQILLNLMSNAIKFTRAGGQVIVSTALEESGEVVVRIRDTGIGMSDKDIETALKPFRQVALARDDREHGTGLGLPLTKAMVEANRATFAIESAVNQGTLVKITFPTTRVLAG